MQKIYGPLAVFIGVLMVISSIRVLATGTDKKQTIIAVALGIGGLLLFRAGARDIGETSYKTF